MSSFETLLQLLPVDFNLKVTVLTYDENLKADISENFETSLCGQIKEMINMYTEWCNKDPNRGLPLRFNGTQINPEDIFFVWMPDNDVENAIKLKEIDPLLFYYLMRGTKKIG